jgi:hypothetical protein
MGDTPRLCAISFRALHWYAIPLTTSFLVCPRHAVSVLAIMLVFVTIGVVRYLPAAVLSAIHRARYYLSGYDADVSIGQK